MNVNMMPQHDHHQGVLVWRVAGVKARLEEARSSQGLELVTILMIMFMNHDNDDV